MGIIHLQAKTHVGQQRHCHRHMAGPCMHKTPAYCVFSGGLKGAWEFVWSEKCCSS